MTGAGTLFLLFFKPPVSLFCCEMMLCPRPKLHTSTGTPKIHSMTPVKNSLGLFRGLALAQVSLQHHILSCIRAQPSDTNTPQTQKPDFFAWLPRKQKTNPQPSPLLGVSRAEAMSLYLKTLEMQWLSETLQLKLLRGT